MNSRVGCRRASNTVLRSRAGFWPAIHFARAITPPRRFQGVCCKNLLIEDWVVTYWSDHAVKELRITEVAQV